MYQPRRFCSLVKLLWILTLGGVVFVPCSSQTQNTTPLLIEHADQMVGYETSRGTVRELSGNVQMRQGTTEIRCDRARQELWSGHAELEGNILITQGAVRMRMQRGEYRSTERRAWGQGNVVIEDSTTTLRAPLGIYELDRQRAIFYRGVELRDSATAVTADSVVYLSRTGERTAWGKVRVVFSRERTSVEGDSAYQNPLENVAWVSGRCFLIEWDTTVNGDTLYLLAESLFMARDTTAQYVRARGNVRLLRGPLAAVADTAWLWERDSIQLEGNPTVWADSAQLSGNVITAQLRQGRVRRVVARGSAALGVVEDSLSLAPHQLLAEVITLRFDGDSLRAVSGSRNVHTLYLLRAEDGAPDGLTRVASDSVAIVLAAGRIERSSWYGSVQSEYVPEHRVQPEERYLQGFRWRAETKPNRAVFLERLISPSSRR